MAKSSKEQIDNDEKIILRELQKDSKESIDTIAKKCGFSRQKVWRIIKRLEKNKTIWGYHAVVDNEKINQKPYFILAKKGIIPVKETADKIVARGIEKEAEEIGVTIRASHYLHGCYDWQICFTAENIVVAKRFCERLKALYFPIIKDLELLETVFVVKQCCVENPDLKDLMSFL